MSCAVALISNATDWLIPLALARGILFALQLAALLVRDKKRGWMIQHHPTSNPSKALPDSPGRAARKPAGKKLFSLAGLSGFSVSGRFMAGVAQRNKFQGLLLFWGPAKQDVSELVFYKSCYCRRTRLQIDSQSL